MTPVALNSRAIVRDHLRGEPIVGPRDGCGGIRNVTLTSIAGRVRWEGYETATIRQVLQAVNAARCVPPLPETEVRRIARSIGKKPAGDGRGAQTREECTKAKDRILELHALSLSAVWPGRTGGTDQAVLHALLKVAFEAGRVEIAVDYRRLSELAGVGRGTITNATRRLHRRGWLRRVARGRVHLEHDARRTTTATLWGLSAPRRLRVAYLDNNAVNLFGLSVHVCDTAGSDAWRRNGLGKNGRRVWLTLSPDRAASADALARQLGLHRSTVYRVLRLLARHELSRQDAAGWWCGTADPQVVSQQLPSAGASQRQRAQHARERDHIGEVVEIMRQRRTDVQRRKRQHAGTHVLRAAPPLCSADTARGDLGRTVLVWILSCDPVRGARICAFVIAAMAGAQRCAPVRAAAQFRPGIAPTQRTQATTPGPSENRQAGG